MVPALLAPSTAVRTAAPSQLFPWRRSVTAAEALSSRTLCWPRTLISAGLVTVAPTCRRMLTVVNSPVSVPPV